MAAIEKAGGTVSYGDRWSDGSFVLGSRPTNSSSIADPIGVEFYGNVTAVQFIPPPSTPPDAALEQVGRLTELRELALSGPAVSDAGLAHLKGLTKLFELSLDGTQVTDAGLAHLKGLTDLSKLSLVGTQVTDAGVAELQKALPRLNLAR